MDLWYCSVTVPLLLCCFILVHRFPTLAYGELVASFYGDSYVKIPVQDFRSDTDVRLQFRTTRNDGLLLLAAGSFDYCVVALQAGAVIVRLDLGSGDATISSPLGITFHDSAWHSVFIKRRQGNVTLTVDKQHVTSTVTPGSFFELNIDKFLFAGGTGDSEHSIFFGNFPAFRGCLRGVAFNGIEILGLARDEAHPSYTYAVTWNCTVEFFAASNRAISFLEDVSFIAFPVRDIPQNVSLNFNVKTKAQNALLTFSAGRQFDSDFFAIEIVNGELRLAFGNAASVVTMPSEVSVSNGDWHNISVTSDGVFVMLEVDGMHMQRKEMTITQLIHQGTHLYVGGVGNQARAVALYRQLDSLRKATLTGGGSVVGCMSNFSINRVTFGFQEAVISKMLATDCTFGDPCSSKPCRPGTKCQENGWEQFHCVCPDNQCMTHGVDKSMASDLVNVRDLIVREGKRMLLSTENLMISEEYKSLGIRDSQVLFRVVNPPSHGEIFVNGEGKMSDRVEFTLSDLWSKRVTYIHDDSEVSEDSIGLQLEFVSIDGVAVPERFRKKYGLTLMVQVMPYNDRPELILPVNNTLTIVSGAPVKITTKIFNVSDVDDLPSEIEYLIQGSGSGYFELLDNVGTRARVKKFTHSDVIEGKLRYIHSGSSNQQVWVQLSDGKDQSEAKSLRIVVIPLELTLASNTGLIIPRGSVHTITRFNLSVVTNAAHQDIEVRYNITEFPAEGKLQRQQNTDNQWTSASTFTQKHLDRNRLRYVHESDSLSNRDYFRFRASTLDVEMQEFEFQIQIIETKVQLVHCTGLHLRGTREGIITSEALKAVSTVPYHSPSDIVYHIIATPTKGHIVRLERRGSGRPQKKRLSFGVNFTQADINEGKIGYKFQKALFSPINDDFEFILFIPGAESGVVLFALSYEPVEGAIRFINNGLLDVLEGEIKIITSEDLFTEKRDVRNFRYTITDGPHHGLLQLVDTVTNSVAQHNITTFSNDDIKERRVYYRHDDSETDEDAFSFVTTPIIDQPKLAVLEITELSGTFDIKIVLKNDNAPKREVEKVFNVVANRGRVITPSDVWYTDPDVNYDSMRLEYEWFNITNGKIVLAHNHSVPVYRFTQKDIAAGRLYFQHHGVHYSRSVVWVTDGYFFSVGMLEVQASEPFVRVGNLSKVMVEKGGSVELLPKYFNFETNLDVGDQNIRFIIVEPPQHGVLKRNNEDRHIFYMTDLKSQHVVYEHDGGDILSDDFKFLVKIENFQSQGTIQIHATSDAYQQHSPKVISNKVAIVNELSHLTLTPSLLNVTHPVGNIACIKFTVGSLPKHGKLSMVGHVGEVQMFTQEDINAGRLSYRHLDKGQLSDVFQFDVRCGASVLTGLEFVFDVVPAVIPLEVLNLTVGEGDFVYVTQDILRIGSKFYRNHQVEFILVKEPHNGQIESLNHQGLRSSQFSMEHVREQKIIYVHDGTEVLSDEFTLMANYRNKQSDLKTVHVIVQPKNDEPPVILVNRKLEVWTGSVTPITNAHLNAEDNDTDPDGIVYRVGQTTNGYVSLISAASGAAVNNFTQADINHQQVIFILKEGAEEGAFEFEVTDGVAVTGGMTFRVESKSLLLFVELSRPLEVFPGLIQPITSSHLKAVTNDSNHSHPVVYTIQTKPTRGRLITYGVSKSEEVTSFFQEQLNANLILYEHTAVMQDWSETDSFTYEVRTAYAPSLTFQVFEIFLSYDNINEYNKAQLMTLNGTVVDEGGSVEISEAKLDVSKLKSKLIDSGLHNIEVNLVIQEVPRHGSLKVRGEVATVGTQFVQDDIDRGRVMYVHDHSESLWDAFSFVIELERRPPVHLHEGYRQLPHSVNLFAIIVRPLNDQPFVLHTQSPTIELIQGFTKNITQATLFTEDLDTPPEGLKYEIITPPNNGHLVNMNYPNQSITMFTQRDIDENRIVFVHDGSTDSGAFYFRVSDGGHKPLYKVFNIRILPLLLELSGPSVLELLQGQFSAMLSVRNLVIQTNGRKDRVTYNITRSPLHGHLYLHNAIADSFTHADVEEGKVTYVQTDLSRYNDSVEFMLSDIHNVIPGRRLEIFVRPNLKKSRHPFRVASGNTAIITVEALDAGDLAVTTSSDPVYYVTVAPQRGRLTKARPNSQRLYQRDISRRKAKNKEVKKKPEELDVSFVKNAVFVFTHDDVVNERVSYHPVASGGTGLIERDSFSFFLTANNAQPVPAKLDIEIVPPRLLDAEDVESDVVDEDEELMLGDSTTPVLSKKTDDSLGLNRISSADHMRIVFLICGVIFVLIVALIAFKCYRRHRRRQQAMAVAKEDSKSPLADPSSPTSTSPPDAATTEVTVGMENRVQSLNSVQSLGASHVPVINVTPDTPTQGRRNAFNAQPPASGLQQMATVVEPPSDGPWTMTLPEAKTVYSSKEGAFNEAESGVHEPPSPDGIAGKKERAAFDWENVDPELLQHCRKTTPVLHKNQYWV